MSNSRIDRTQGSRPHVIAVCGSRREGSYTRKALFEVLSGVQEAGGTGELLDLAEVDLSPLNTDIEPTGDELSIPRRIRQADAVILGTPMYHGSFSGVLKNALDYCGFDDFEDTTVGLLVVSGGAFPTPALNQLRTVCRSLNAWVMPYQAAIPETRNAFNENGFSDDNLRTRVRNLGVQAVEYANIEARSAQLDLPQEV